MCYNKKSFFANNILTTCLSRKCQLSTHDRLCHFNCDTATSPLSSFQSITSPTNRQQNALNLGLEINHTTRSGLRRQPSLQQFHQHTNVPHHLLPKVHKQKKLKWMTRRPKIKRKRRKKRQVSISPSYSPTIDNVSCRTSKGALENTEDFAK